MRRRRNGSNVIEFALTFPVFVTMVFGLAEYGWFFMNKALVDVAVSRGCRAGAIVDPYVASPTAAAEEAMAEWLSVTMTGCGEGCDVADTGDVPTRQLTCTVSLPYTPLTGMLPLPETLHSQTMARMEWQRAR